MRKARETACEWLVRLDEGISKEELDELYEWLRANPSHPVLLVQLAEHWDDQARLAGIMEICAPKRASLGRYMKTGAIAAAAASILVCSLILVSFIPFGRSLDPSLSSAATEGDRRLDLSISAHETAVGEQLSLQLSDGSVVVLNTESRLETRYSETERVAHLERGEASFSVARDESRPFRVHARRYVIEAIGTHFNVQLETEGTTELTVSEGAVRITAMAGESGAARRDELPMASAWDVAAGEIAIIEGSGVTVRQASRPEIEANLSWREGVLIFRGERLETVLAEVQRYTLQRLVIADDATRGLRVGGRFRTGDVDSFLFALREGFGVVTRTRADGVVVLSAE